MVAISSSPQQESKAQAVITRVYDGNDFESYLLRSAVLELSVDELKEVVPDLDLVLAKRQALLRRLYRRALSRKTIRLQAPKPGRNERCPCGSGKKYKKCCTPKSSPRYAQSRGR
jgi:uncharacterized coiled-coil protein SlyX